MSNFCYKKFFLWSELIKRTFCQKFGGIFLIFANDRFSFSLKLFDRTLGGGLAPSSQTVHFWITPNSPRAQCYKTFLSVTYEFLFYARVFVRLGWKSLPGTNSPLYYENFKIVENFCNIAPSSDTNLLYLWIESMNIEILDEVMLNFFTIFVYYLISKLIYLKFWYKSTLRGGG